MPRHPPAPRGAALAAALVLLAAAAPPAFADLTWEETQEALAGALKGAGMGRSMPLDAPPLARVAAGFEPEGVHLTPWGADGGADGAVAVLFSWQTGAARTAPAAAPPPPYDPAAVAAVVELGFAPGAYERSLEGGPGASLVYNYSYRAEAGGVAYASPIIHHVLVGALPPGRRTFYRVGNDADGWSREFAFTVPGAPAAAIRLGVFGDIGQTLNSTATLAVMEALDTSAVLTVGDLSYADDHMSDAGATAGRPYWVDNPAADASVAATRANGGVLWTSDQRRWDAWARMMEPLLATHPMLACPGNHEIEWLEGDGRAFAAYNARYPQPRRAGAPVATAPDARDAYLDPADINRFVNEATFEPQNSFSSLALPPVHVITFNSYAPYGAESTQARWFAEAAAAVDRAATPWLVVMWHTAAYHTYEAHFREADALLAAWEPLLRAAGVDLVLNGHVHAYERSDGVYNYTADACAPSYITLGAGGNLEGLYQTFAFDAPAPSYCADASAYELPAYEPTPSGARPLFYPFAAADGAAAYCPAAAPAYSRARRPEFGSGVLEVLNATDARWSWHASSAPGGAARAVDVALLSKDPRCENQNRGLAAADLAALRARAAAAGAGPAPAAAPSSVAAAARRGARALAALAALVPALAAAF